MNAPRRMIREAHARYGDGLSKSDTATHYEEQLPEVRLEKIRTTLQVLDLALEGVEDERYAYKVGIYRQCMKHIREAVS